jgi:hypothetical protein
VLYDIAFETTSTDRACGQTIFTDQHPRAGATIRRALDAHDRRKRATLTPGVRVIERVD